MKYLHVMNYSNFAVSKSYIQFVEEFFCASDHTFVFFGNYDKKYDDITSECNILHLNKRKELMQYLRKAELILLHALTLNVKMQMFCALSPCIMKKIVWIAWGGDLYIENKSQTVKNAVINIVKKLFIRKLRFFVSIFDPDADYFKKNYKSKAEVLNSGYFMNFCMDIYKKEFEYTDVLKKYNEGKSINILVGHQANPDLNHIRILRQLYAYKKENIRIYLPLNYGDRSNVEEVEKCAIELFGEKAVVIKDWMSAEKYDELLMSIDVAVFDVMRQIGLGNINKLIHLQKKLYMLPGSVMYEYYKANNLDIFDCTMIGKIGFEDFISGRKSELCNEFVKNEIMNVNKKREQWEKVFLLAEK